MNFYSHIVLASNLEEQLRPENSKEYYLGTVVPDIRYLYGWRRQHTHLPMERIAEFAAQYPHLESFLLGYQVHCIIDEFDSADQVLRFPANLMMKRLPRQFLPMLVESFYLMHRAVKREKTEAHARCYLGLVALYRGQYQGAISQFETYLAQSRKARDWEHIAYSIDNLALARLYQGTTDGVAAMLAESLPLVVKMQHRREMPWAFDATAGLAALQDQPELAARLYGASRALRDANSTLSLALDDCPGFSQWWPRPASGWGTPSMRRHGKQATRCLWMMPLRIACENQHEVYRRAHCRSRQRRRDSV